jgi:hypothetical protein
VRKSLNPGDKVNWHHEPRGGYGYSVSVAAVVVKVGPKRAQVRTARLVNGEWQQVTRWVDEDRLSTRTKIVPEVDGIFRTREVE